MIEGCSMFDGKSKEVQENMASYLAETYNKEFVVESPRITGNEGFGYRVWQAKAHPKDQPEIEFNVRWDVGEPGAYYDGYLRMLWSAQGKKEIGQYLKELYGQEVPLNYEFSVADKSLQNLNHSQVISQSKDKIYFSLVYYVLVTGDFDKQKEAEKVFEVLQKYIFSNDIKVYHLIVYYVNPHFKENTLSESNQTDISHHFEQLYKENKLYNYLSLNRKSNIQTPDDIVQKFHN